MTTKRPAKTQTIPPAPGVPSDWAYLATTYYIGIKFGVSRPNVNRTKATEL